MPDLPSTSLAMPRQRWAWLARLLIVLPFGLYLWLIYRYGVNVLVNDEWVIVPFVAKVMQGEAWLGDLFAQLSENRFAVLKLLVAWLIPPTRWNTVLFMYLSIGMAALALWGLWRIYRQALGPWLRAFVPVAWLWVNLSQYENMLFGLQLTFWNAMAAGIWAVYFITQPGWRAFGAACLLAVISTFSATSGLALWPVGFVLLWLTHAPRRKWLLWLLLAVVILSFYFYDFTFGLHIVQSVERSLLGQIIRIPPVVLIVAANVIGAAFPLKQTTISLLVGMAMAAILAKLLWSQWQQRVWWPRHAWPAWGLLLFGLAVALLIAIGRAKYGVGVGMLSRYITLGMPTLVALYILILNRLYNGPKPIDLSMWPVGLLPMHWRPAPIPNQRLIGGLALVLFLGALGANWQGYVRAVAWARRYGYTAKFILQTADDPIRVLETAIRPHPNMIPHIAQNIPLARDLGLNAFSEPVAWWLLLATDDRQMTPPLAAAPGLIQQFTCPVATLYDVSLEFAQQGQHQAQPEIVYVQLVDENEATPLAAGMLDLAKLEGEGGWGLLRLAQPLHECQGRALRVEIRAATASGGAVAVHYPTYYPGTLMIGAQTLAGRSLGLELNVHHFPIRDGLVHFTPAE